MDVQAPSATRRKSYGSGPVAVPPALTGSSARSRCGPTVMSCAEPSKRPSTVTCAIAVLAPVEPSSAGVFVIVILIWLSPHLFLLLLQELQQRVGGLLGLLF